MKKIRKLIATVRFLGSLTFFFSCGGIYLFTAIWSQIRHLAHYFMRLSCISVLRIFLVSCHSVRFQSREASWIVEDAPALPRVMLGLPAEAQALGLPQAALGPPVLPPVMLGLPAAAQALGLPQAALGAPALAYSSFVR